MPIGPAFSADSANVPSTNRFGRFGETIVGQGHGKYYEAVSRQKMYAGHTSAGRAPGTALGVAPPISIYNPVGSNIRVAIGKVGTAQAATGTLGSGVLSHCAYTINGPTASQSNVVPVVGSGAAITPKNLDIGGPNASAAQLWELPTLNAAPVLLYPFAELTEAVGGTTAAAQNTIQEDVDGGIILEPGAGWCLEALAAAGTSPLIHAGVSWEEITAG